MTNKNTKKDKKDTIYNVSKIIKYCSIKYTIICGLAAFKAIAAPVTTDS